MRITRLEAENMFIDVFEQHLRTNELLRKTIAEQGCPPVTARIDSDIQFWLNVRSPTKYEVVP